MQKKLNFENFESALFIRIREYVFNQTVQPIGAGMQGCRDDAAYIKDIARCTIESSIAMELKLKGYYKIS